MIKFKVLSGKLGHDFKWSIVHYISILELCQYGLFDRKTNLENWIPISLFTGILIFEREE